VPPQLREAEIARGPGPQPFRIALAVVAGLYLFALLKHPSQRYQPFAYFTECTKLFPEADNVALEYHLDAWSCDQRAWVAIDPGPYFPIEADDKESRFQRLGYFYADRGTKEERKTVLYALDEYMVGRHGDVDDGLTGKIGGIRMIKIRRPLPEIGDHVERYVYRPLATPQSDQAQELFHSPAKLRKERCGIGTGGMSVMPDEPEAPAP
jgi:hypothetical protein